jgi:oligosaccharide repeat unit polymerase
MFRIAKYILSTRNLYFFPCFCLLGLYLIPSLIGNYYFADDNSFLILIMLLVSVATYLLTYGFFSSKELNGLTKPSRISIYISYKAMLFGVIFSYLAFLAWVISTTPHLAFFDAFRGASPQQLAVDREMQFHARHGFQAIIPYINVLFVNLLCPLVILRGYVIKHKFRHLILLGFLFTLAMNLEKALALVVLIPLLVMQINQLSSSKRAKKTFYFLFAFLIALIFTTSFLSSVKFTSYAQFSKQNRYTYFDSSYTLGYMLNRVIWIPYVTVYDTLGYFDSALDGQHTLGASSSLLSAAFGLQRVNVERGVFKYEWGQNPTGTGSANAVYFTGAFVDFGWFGVIFFSMILAIITRIIKTSKTEEAKYLYYSYVFNLSTGSLISVLFSNYLLLLVLFAVFFRFRATVTSLEAGT